MIYIYMKYDKYNRRMPRRNNTQTSKVTMKARNDPLFLLYTIDK